MNSNPLLTKIASNKHSSPVILDNTPKTPVCVKCTATDKENKNRLDPYLFPITYQNKEIINNLALPRKYTSIHNDETKQIFLNIGHDYDQGMLSSPEAVNNESQVVGYWAKRKGGKFKILLEVLVSTEKNPQAYIRNIIFCQELGVVLEGIAFAETPLLSNDRSLRNTKIYIHFKSINAQYDRTEYWGKLKNWVSNPDKKRDSKKKR